MQRPRRFGPAGSHPSSIAPRLGMSWLCAALVLGAHGVHAAQSFQFSAYAQSSPRVTALHWNPVLSHVSRETGLEIELKVAALPKSGEELANPAGADFVLAPVPYMDGGWDSIIVSSRAGPER